MSLVKLEVSRQVLLMLYGATTRDADATRETARVMRAGGRSPEQTSDLNNHAHRTERVALELRRIVGDSENAPFKTFVVKS